MPAHDLYHDHVKQALINDGWTITHDPYRIQVGLRWIYVDLGVSRVIAAEKEARKIAVEIKSFTGHSDANDLEKALGQYLLYHDHLEDIEPERQLHLAVPSEAYKVFEEPLGAVPLKKRRLSLLVFDELTGGDSAMDQLNHYREIIEQILAEHAALPYAHGELEDFTVFDRQNDRYFVMTQGWGKDGRVHGCLIHVDIIDGKFWIQYDGTEEGVAVDLERAGVPKNHIVLGFRRPELRPYTEYAAA